MSSAVHISADNMSLSCRCAHCLYGPRPLSVPTVTKAEYVESIVNERHRFSRGEVIGAHRVRRRRRRRVACVLRVELSWRCESVDECQRRHYQLQRGRDDGLNDISVIAGSAAE